jgi:hypothetical protein
MDRKVTVFCVLILVFSGWITSAVQIYLADVNNKLLLNNSLDNPFNLVRLQLNIERDKYSPLDLIKLWLENGWTAETGSLRTICFNDRSRLSSILTENEISIACSLVEDKEDGL